MSIIKLNLDVSTIDGSQLTGIGNYVKNLASSLQAREDISVVGGYRLSRWKRVKNIKKNIPGIPLQPYWPLFSNYSRNDIFHGPDFRIAPFKYGKKIVTIHDLSYEYPEFVTPDFKAFGVKRMEALLFQSRPDFIITDSEFIRNEFVERYPDFETRTRTVHLAAHYTKLQNGQQRPFDFPYILFIGLERRKNPEGAIKAFELLKSSVSNDLRLVVIGKAFNNLWSDYLKQLMTSSPYHADIHYLGFVPDNDLPTLYSNAFCFLFPSFYEGFGIPILEAMQYGCPVITSNCGAMKEVSGESAILIDPHNKDEMANAISSLFENDVRNGFIQKGFDQTKMYTWNKCADSTFNIYKEIL